jgi:UDP-GlcNAc:undecaprenyl-phosphate GlcNAc-1-phosphate transferase
MNMYSLTSYLIFFISAALLSWVLTPVAGWLALKVGCVDRPGGRKIHARNIPYFGGIAIFVSFIAVLLAAYFMVPEGDGLPEAERVMLGFLLGGGVILVTGLIDDFRGTRPVLKLLGQVIAGLILVVLGFRIEVLTNPFGGELYFGAVFGGLLTVIWVVSMVNAMNLIDGLDGLASGVALIASMTLFAVAIHRDDSVDMVITIILAGSCLGFLRHNFFPAKIFLGDAGSMFLGFVLAVIGIQGIQKSATVMTLLIPLSTLAVPMLDTFMAIVRRSKVNRNIFSADHEHLHHRLVRLGIQKKNVVLLIYFFCVHLGITAFVLTLIPIEYTLIILVLISMGIMLAIQTLGFIEDKMAIRLQESEKESMVDEKTGLSSFRYFTRRVIDEIQRCDRYEKETFSLLVFELKGLRDSLAQSPDEEKNMDSFRTAAQFFQKNVRATDLVSYLGGESFVIFTPEQGEGKEYLIERLRTIFKNMKADLGPLQLDQEMKLKVRAIDYPGDRGIVQELLRDAVEVL